MVDWSQSSSLSEEYRPQEASRLRLAMEEVRIPPSHSDEVMNVKNMLDEGPLWVPCLWRSTRLLRIED